MHEEDIISGIKKAVLSEAAFKDARITRLRKLSGYDAASAETVAASRQLIDLHKPHTRIYVYDFYSSPSDESAFLSLLRSTGLTALVPMQRKKCSRHNRLIRVTAHLEGPLDAFDYMITLLPLHGYIARKMP